MSTAVLDTDLDKIAERIRDCIRQTSVNIIRIGTHLRIAKKKLEHGEFAPWLQREFDWSERTARNYMRASEFAAKSATISDLPPTTLYLLAAPSTPKTIKAEVIEALESRRPIDHREVEQRIREARQARRPFKPITLPDPPPQARKAKQMGRVIVRTQLPPESDPTVQGRVLVGVMMLREAMNDCRRSLDPLQDTGPSTEDLSAVIDWLSKGVKLRLKREREAKREAEAKAAAEEAARKAEAIPSAESSPPTDSEPDAEERARTP